MRRTALLAAALAVVSFAVVIPGSAQADDADFVTVTPTTVVAPREPTPTSTLNVHVKLATTPADVTIAINDTGVIWTYSTTTAPFIIDEPVSQLDCTADNFIRVTVKYTGPGQQPPDQEQVVSGITRICPAITVSPPEVVGAGAVTVTLPELEAFDTFGAQQGAKTLSIDGTNMGDFGYKVVPTATKDLACGDHTVKLTQPSPDGPLAATTKLTVYCGPWTVTPKGIVLPKDTMAFTVDSGTQSFDTCSTADVYLDDPDDLSDPNDSYESIGTMNQDPSGHMSNTFSFGGDFWFSSGAHHIIVRYYMEPVLKFAPTRLAAPVSPCTVPHDVYIPFHVLRPSAYMYTQLDQSALPYSQTVSLSGFNGPDNAYDARDIQPKTLFINDQQIGTSTTDKWTGPITPPCGDSTLKITQPTSMGVASVDQPLTVYCPKVELSPAVIASDSQPRTLLLSGTAFHPVYDFGEGGQVPQPYVITLDGKPVAADDMDEAGAFASTFPASGLACGPHDVTVTEQVPPFGGGGSADASPPATPPTTPAAAAEPADPNGPLTVSTVLVVNCPSIVPPPDHGKPHTQGRTPTTPNTTLAIQPQIIFAGMTAQVTGTGFTHNHKVTLTWVLPNGTKQPACQAPVTANKDGVFMFLCLTQRHEQVGERTLTATDGTHTASAAAIVMNGPMQPSGRRTRDSRLVVRN